MSPSLFDHDDYRNYLKTVLREGTEARGKLAALARHLGCQSSFLSQVLTSKTHLSLEHAIRVSDFLSHTEEERQFFLLLIQKDKAGSKQLEQYFSAQLNAILERRQIVSERIGVKDDLKPEAQAEYYSAWWYLAIHLLPALPGMQTRDAIARRLGLGHEVIERALRFLASTGLLSEKEGRYSIGNGRIHLGQGSPMLARHHANWRMRAIHAVDNPKPKDLHYSGMIGVSRQTAERIRTMMLELIQQAEPMVRDSPVESLYAIGMDLFEV